MLSSLSRIFTSMARAVEWCALPMHVKPPQPLPDDPQETVIGWAE